MAINLGSGAISNIKIGDNQVYKVYKGSDVVWDSGVPPTPVTIKAIKFESSGAQTLGVDATKLGTIAPNFEYSRDNGATWTTWNVADALGFGNGTSLYIRGSNTFLAKGGDNYTRFVFGTSEPVACSGNIMHLFDYTQDLTSFPDDSSNSSRGVKYMFYHANVLTTPPSLPAIVLPAYAYYYMFALCSSLTIPPALPAMNVPTSAYQSMFQLCNSLDAVPALPATSIGSMGYGVMFAQCSKIKMSETQTGEYQNRYEFGSIPGGYGTNMFSETGGTFTGRPDQTTYYTANTIIS